MACYLRAYGDKLNVDEVARSTGLDIDVVFRKGEPRNAVSKVLNQVSGCFVCVSAGDSDHFNDQLIEARQFLDSHAFELRKLASRSDVDAIFLDFGVKWLGDAAQFWRFPSDLLATLGDLGIDLEISHYPA